MNSTMNEWLNLIFRWLHVIAGVMWIGHLYFFNFVNSQLVKTYTPESKKAVLPELMPRALYFFRWGALYTWVTGFLLLGIVYYMGGVMTVDGTDAGKGAALGASLGTILVLFFVYDMLWKSPLAKNETVGVAVSYVILMAILFGLSRVMSGRALWIQTGAIFGTVMAMNVWMRIWPSQRKIIAGVKGTAPAPDASVPALAGLRSKHNTYLSIPLILTMVSNHFPTVYGDETLSVVYLGVAILAGWGISKFLYTKAASPATAAI